MTPVVDVYNFIYNLANNILECHHLSLDMAQHIFMQYTKKLEDNPNMDEKYKKFWIIRATKNKCFNYIRDNKKFVYVDPADYFSGTIDLSPNPSQTLEEDEEKEILLDKLKNNINKLSDTQKEILHLRFEKDLSYNEIIQLTGYSVDKVKSTVHRAIKTLKKKMN